MYLVGVLPQSAEGGVMNLAVDVDGHSDLVGTDITAATEEDVARADHVVVDLRRVGHRGGHRVVDGAIAVEVTEGNQGDVGRALGLKREGAVGLAGQLVDARLDRTRDHHVTRLVLSPDEEIAEGDRAELGLERSGGHGQLLRGGFTLSEGPFESNPRCPQWATKWP
jgi:hypothetical protein